MDRKGECSPNPLSKLFSHHWTLFGISKEYLKKILKKYFLLHKYRVLTTNT